MLGFNGCKTHKNISQENSVEPINEEAIQKEEMVCMYGVPQASYSIGGKVIDEKKRPIKANVYVSTYPEDEGIETQTADDGSFNVKFTGFPADSIYIKIITLKTKEQFTFVRKLNYNNQVDQWNWGEAVTNFEFVIQSKDEPIMLKYGVPYTPKTESIEK